MNCACGCGQRAVQEHHVFYKQELRRLRKTRRGGGPRLQDPRNLVPVAFDCHGNHHSRSKPYRLEVLPDSVFEFGREFMGPAAYDYLRRRYAGEDVRLDALLEMAA